MWKHSRSRFPAANVRRLPEWYSTDTFISDVPVSDDGVPGHGGCKLVQIYDGLDSELLSTYPMASESSLPDTLCEFIHEYGAMAGLKSDNDKSETSFAMKDIFRMYLIKDKQSEPHYQHQNPIDRRIQDVKRMIKGIMDHTECPSSYWVLCLLYFVRLLNVLANSKGCIPLTVVTGLSLMCPLFKYSTKGCKNQFVTAGRLVTVLDMRPSTTNTITTNRATKITAHCKLTLLWISYSNPNSLGTRANESRRSLPQQRKQAQTLKATTKGVRHNNYAEPGHHAQSQRPSMTPNQSAKDIHKYARNIVASSYNFILITLHYEPPRFSS